MTARTLFGANDARARDLPVDATSRIEHGNTPKQADSHKEVH